MRILIYKVFEDPRRIGLVRCDCRSGTALGRIPSVVDLGGFDLGGFVVGDARADDAALVELQPGVLG